MLGDPRDPVLVALPAPREQVPVASAVRSTLIAASIEGLRRSARYDDYRARVPAERSEALAFVGAGTWLPMDVALAHYAAIDALGIPESSAIASGQEVGARLNHTFLGVVLKIAGRAAASPWTPLAQTGKLFSRVFRGGALQVERVTAKEARIEVVGLPLMASAYFRGALRGQVQAGCELFCARAYAREVEPGARPCDGAVRVSWV